MQTAFGAVDRNLKFHTGWLRDTVKELVLVLHDKIHFTTKHVHYMLLKQYAHFVNRNNVIILTS